MAAGEADGTSGQSVIACRSAALARPSVTTTMLRFGRKATHIQRYNSCAKMQILQPTLHTTCHRTLRCYRRLGTHERSIVPMQAAIPPAHPLCNRKAHATACPMLAGAMAYNAFAIESEEIDAWMAEDLPFEIALVLYGTGQFDPTGSPTLNGKSLGETIKSLCDGVFGENNTTSTQSADTRHVPGWKEDLKFITVLATEDICKKVFGGTWITAEPYAVLPRVPYTRAAPLGQRPEKKTVEVRACIVDKFPQEVMFGNEALFDKQYTAGMAAPGIPATIYIDNCRAVDVAQKVPRLTAVNVLWTDLEAQLAMALGPRVTMQPVMGGATPAGMAGQRGPTGVKIRLWLLAPHGERVEAEASTGALLPADGVWPHRIEKREGQPTATYQAGCDLPRAQRKRDLVKIKWVIPALQTTRVLTKDGQLGYRVGEPAETDTHPKKPQTPHRVPRCAHQAGAAPAHAAYGRECACRRLRGLWRPFRHRAEGRLRVAHLAARPARCLLGQANPRCWEAAGTHNGGAEGGLPRRCVRH